MELAIFFQGLFAWFLFGFLHSILATDTIKDLIPIKGKWYRIAYNLVSIVTLGWVFSVTPPVELPILDVSQYSPVILTIAFFLLIVSIGFGLFGLMA